MSNTVKQSGEYIAVKVPADTKGHYLTMSDDIGYLECGVFSWTSIPAAYKAKDMKIIGLISEMNSKIDKMNFALMFDLLSVDQWSQWLVLKKLS